MLHKKSAGIYAWYSKISNKVYIGQSVQLIKRHNDHLSALKANRHDNTHLQNFVNRAALESKSDVILADVNHYRVNELQAADRTLEQVVRFYLEKNKNHKVASKAH